MKNKKNCPKCSSNNVKIINYLGVKCVVCNNCGFDETKQYEVFSEEKRRNLEELFSGRVARVCRVEVRRVDA